MKIHYGFRKWAATVVFVIFILSQTALLIKIQHQGDVISENNTQSCANRKEGRHVLREVVGELVAIDQHLAQTDEEKSEISQVVVYVQLKYPEIVCPS